MSWVNFHFPAFILLISLKCSAVWRLSSCLEKLKGLKKNILVLLISMIEDVFVGKKTDRRAQLIIFFLLLIGKGFH